MALEASALQRAGRLPALAGVSPYLRLQSDERLIAFVRRGHQGAFDALMRRYQARLLVYCRHMLASNEDAEDVLQEVFAAAYTAIRADDRPIHARAWLYRIARNRCLNHLRRPVPIGQETMDVFERSGGASAADTAHRREEFRLIVSDVHALPETQRSALLLRQIEGLTYEQIAEAMDVTVASVKSLLVRARMSLAEASEARLLTCAEARLELGQVAEGVAKSSPQVRRHVKSCSTCREFKRELRRTGRAVAAVVPVGPLIALKGALVAKLGGGGAAGGSAVATGGASGGTASGVLSAMAGSVAAKAATGVAAAALVTVGAAEVERGDPPAPRATPPGAPAPGSADEPAERPLADTTRAAALAERPPRHPDRHAAASPGREAAARDAAGERTRRRRSGRTMSPRRPRSRRVPTLPPSHSRRRSSRPRRSRRPDTARVGAASARPPIRPPRRSRRPRRTPATSRSRSRPTAGGRALAARPRAPGRSP